MSVVISGRKIGQKEKPFIIAELSANHNGSIESALKTIKKAKECGADAIKIQTYSADTMTIDCNEKDFIIKGGLWDGYNLYELYKLAETPFSWHKRLFEYAKEIGIILFSTPFDETAVDLLETLNTPAYKIASFELCDLPLIKYIAEKGKPIIMSTGLSSESEINDALKTARNNGCKDIILLHCISSYPAPAEESNLLQIKELSRRYELPIGLSDHTLGTTVALTSIALGACVIEKHFILDRSEKGPDSDFSIEPIELKSLCNQAEIAWKSLGKASFKIQKSEKDNMVFRRSIYFIKDLPKGHILKKDDIKRIRPGKGLPPKMFDFIIGKRLKKDVKRGQATSMDLFD